MQRPIVCKFGGSSTADAACFRRIRSILHADPRRRFIVVSAPGKLISNSGNPEAEEKMTDLLLRCHTECSRGLDPDPLLKVVFDRYRDIARALELNMDLEPEFSRIAQSLPTSDAAYAASRGEYLCARLLAAYLHLPFVDTAEMVCFDAQGHFDAKRTGTRMQALRTMQYAILPGFYGSGPDGRICTFPRGGSDITGALVAKAVDASLYENWTDVNGLLSADPGLVANPVLIPEISYKQMELLAQAGANVLQAECLRPTAAAGIPTRIRNTFAPECPGTLISDCMSSTRPCISGCGGYVALNINFSENTTVKEIHSTLMAVHTAPLAASVAPDAFRCVFSTKQLPAALEVLRSAFPEAKIRQGEPQALVRIVDPDMHLSDRALRKLANDTETSLLGLSRIPDLRAWQMYCFEKSLKDFINAVYLVLYS